MIRDINNDDIHDLAGAYALDALDDVERARFEAHLQRCASCRQDVADFRSTAGHLGRAAAEPPPPALRGTVLDAIRDVRQDSPVDIGHEARRRNRARVVRALAVAASVIAIAALAFGVRDARRDRDAAEDLAATLAAPDATTVALEGESGTGRLVWSADEGRAVLLLDGLPPLEPGRAYALWYIADDVPQPIAFVTTDDDRVVALVDRVPADAETVGITEEPATGVPAPTGPILLTGNTA